MLNIVIPMAGAGSRFKNAGFVDPKPMIKIHEIPMIQYVVDNIRPPQKHRFTFIVQEEHQKRFKMDVFLQEIAPDCNIIPINGLTRGAAETVLLAKNEIPHEESLMIVNSDQFVVGGTATYLDSWNNSSSEGFLMTMSDDDPKWSFVRRDSAGNIKEIVEKQVVSNEATVGIYNFRQSGTFFHYADKMIKNDERVGGEFYVAPVYNKLISGGGVVETFSIGDVQNNMFGLGIPEDLEYFQNLPWTKHIYGETK